MFDYNSSIIRKNPFPLLEYFKEHQNTNKFLIVKSINLPNNFFEKI